MIQPTIQYRLLTDNESECRTLIKIDIPRPKLNVAIILDMSDSCLHIRDVARRLPSLLTKLPRDSSLLVYRLSAFAPLNNFQTDTVGHLIDGSITLTSWLDDRSLVEVASWSGSMLRPVMESISAGCSKLTSEPVRAIVITDGELLDRGKLELPGNLKLTGICPAGISPDFRNWRRVVGDFPLYCWDDRSLDRGTIGNYEIPKQQIRVHIETSNEDLLSVGLLDPPTGTFESFPESLTWDTSLGPITLLLVSRASLSQATSIALTSSNEKKVIRLSLADANLIDLSDCKSLTHAIALKNAEGIEECILDITANGADAIELNRIAAEIESLAKSRIPWTPQSELLSRLIAMIQKQRSDVGGIDAVVCFTRCRDDCSRLVVCALRKKNAPSLIWSQESGSPCGHPIQNIKIRFDRMEGRWLAALELGKEFELDPSASQILAESIEFDKDKWNGYYSGPLAPFYANFGLDEECGDCESGF